MLRIADEWCGSDVGRQRQGNEDNYYVRAPLFVVADGMGGAQSGEVASEMAVESFGDGLPDNGTPADGLRHLIEEANRKIHERSRVEHQRSGMGTTVTAAYVAEESVIVAHVGDSRAYRLRGGELTRLTDDHSLVFELVKRGKLTEEQAESHPQRSVITRALGPEPSVQVDIEEYPARDGDLFLLCSDGLTSMVQEAALKPLLVDEDKPLSQVGSDLIAAANAAGGRDNITVILFRLEEVSMPGERTRAAAEAAPVDHSNLATSEYDTFQGEAVPLKGTSRPAEAHTRLSDEARASDETEAEYRRSGTVALKAVPRAEPIEEGRRTRHRSRAGAAGGASRQPGSSPSARPSGSCWRSGSRRARSTSSASTSPTGTW